MREKKVLEFAEVWKGVEAMMAKIPEGSGRPISIAVVDAVGDVIVLIRTDGAHDFHTNMALKKAWTAARWRRNTREIWERMQQMYNFSVHEFGTEFCIVPGGQAIIEPGQNLAPGETECYGAIGISGRAPADDDELIANVGLKAIQEYIWPSK